MSQVEYSPIERQKTIHELSLRIKKEFAQESTGHDWLHMERVLKTARCIVRKEGVPVNIFVVEAAVLLHDIADWKFRQGDENIGLQKAAEILTGYRIRPEIIDQVCEIINSVSFKGAGVPSKVRTIESKIVQDADRLDALGAIGIARAFAYGGHVGRPIYDPEILPHPHSSFEEYKSAQTTTINHFFEKLLLLPDRLNTQTARKIARIRVERMRRFLDWFQEECNIKL